MSVTRSGQFRDLPIISQWGKTQVPTSNTSQICSNRSEPCSFRLLLMTPMQICICNPWKVIWGHVLTSWGQNTFLLITFALIELETWDNRQSVFPIEAHQMLCNMDYLGHLVAFSDLELRSNFEVDLLWSTYMYMIRFVSTRQTRWYPYYCFNLRNEKLFAVTDFA